MGRLTLALGALVLLVGAGAAYLPSPYWVRALYAALTGAPLFAVFVVTWGVTRFVLGERAAPWAWSMIGAGLGVGLVVLSVVVEPGPGRMPQVGPVRIDLPLWAASAAGLAGAIAAVGFGIAATGCVDRRVALVGACVAAGAFLTLQPAMQDLGIPTVGPIGLAVAVLAVTLGRVARNRLDDGSATG